MVPPRCPFRRPLTRPWPVVAALVTVTLLAGACSTGGSSDTAAAAAATVSDTFRLPDDTRGCLEEHFASDPTARGAVSTFQELTDSQRDALAGVIEACVSADQFAGAVAARITAAIPPPDSSQTATQLECLTTRLLALDDTDRRVLAVGLVLTGNAPETGDLATQRNDVVNRLFEACSVVVAP